jgi:hypothetical protein
VQHEILKTTAFNTERDAESTTLCRRMGGLKVQRQTLTSILNCNEWLFHVPSALLLWKFPPVPSGSAAQPAQNWSQENGEEKQLILLGNEPRSSSP